MLLLRGFWYPLKTNTTSFMISLKAAFTFDGVSSVSKTKQNNPNMALKVIFNDDKYINSAGVLFGGLVFKFVFESRDVIDSALVER